ncbi:MAG: MaoC/PaaZ C-terminal domain-containing protein [Bradymonadia bacterium]
MRSVSAIKHLPKQIKTLRSFAGALNPFASKTKVIPAQPFKLNEALVRDFILWSGGNPEDWGPYVPPTLFPFWTMPSLVRCIQGRGMRLTKLLNGGCTIHYSDKIPTNIELKLHTHFDRIETADRYDLIHLHSETHTPSGQCVLESKVRFLLPKPREQRTNKTTAPLRPPEETKLASLSSTANDGFTFACLTGDFNPIHWLRPAARLSGFKSCIQHGFGTLSKAYEHLLSHGLLSRSHGTLSANFTRPVPLPSDASLFVEGNQISVWVDEKSVPSLKGHFSS